MFVIGIAGGTGSGKTTFTDVIVEKFKEEFLKLVPDGVFITPEHGKWIDL